MTTFDGPAARHAHLPLHGIRVLECGDALANAYAGRLLVELGADVVKVECAGGDPLRSVGPFAPGGASIPFAYYHAGKRMTTAEGDDLRALTDRADVVVRCTRDGVDVLDDRILDAALVERPDLIVADISTFGRQSGDRSISDLLALAASGLLLLNVDTAGDPLRYRGELASVHAACAAVLAIVTALDARLDGSRGRRIDVSAQAAISAVVLAIAVYTYTGQLAVFGGIPAIAPWGFFDCADGTVLIMVNEDVQWVNLRRVLGDPAWAAVELFDTNAVRREQHDIVNGMVAEELAGWMLDDIVDACRRANVPASRVHTAADVVAWPHLHERRWFTHLAVGPGAEPVLVPVRRGASNARMRSLRRPPRHGTTTPPASWRPGRRPLRTHHVRPAPHPTPPARRCRIVASST